MLRPPHPKPDTSLETLYKFLRKYSLSQSLYLVSCINAAFKYGRHEMSLDVEIPDYIKHWLRQYPNDRYLGLMISASRLVRFLLLSGANDFRDKALQLEDGSLVQALNLINELYEPSIEPKEGDPLIASKILGRISQWQFPLQAAREPIIGRAYLLFTLLPKEVPKVYPMEKKMHAYFGIGAFEFMASGLALWLKTNGILDYELNIEIEPLKKIISPNSLMKFLELSSGTTQQYKEVIRGSTWKDANKLKDIYFPDPLMRMPAIKADTSRFLRPETYLVPNAKHLLDRASDGVFYLLSNKEQELAKLAGHSGKNDFRVSFGEVYRAYVGKQLGQPNSEFGFIDLDVELAGYKATKLPDFALIRKEVCILFEVKLNILSLDTRTFFEQNRLEQEVTSGNISKAIKQLNDFKYAVMQARVPHQKLMNIKRVVIVLVSYEDIFVANPSLLPLLFAKYGHSADDMQIACVSDIEATGTAIDGQHDVVTLLCDKIDRPDLKHNALATYFEAIAGVNNPILKAAAKSYFKHLQFGPNV
jgi:hypothetical protein